MSISRLILHCLVNDEEYSKRVIPHIEKSYFDSAEERLVFEKIKEYSQNYQAIPPIEAIEIELINQKGLSEDQEENLESLLGKLKLKIEKKPSLQWLVDKTEEFCKEKAIYNALQSSIRIFESENKNTSEILNLFKDALSVSFDVSIGHDYFEDAIKRWEYYTKEEFKIPFRIEYLNKITKGGFSQKTLNLILASVHGGKTAHMCSLAADNLLDGKNVLYITNEIQEEEIGLRIDAKLFENHIGMIKDIPKSMFANKVKNLLAKTTGKLIIKQYSAGMSHTGIYRNLLDELKLKKNFIPDIIYIDYLNICSSERVKMSPSLNSYTYMKLVAEELRGLGIEKSIPIVSACQLTRSGAVSSDPGLDDISESFAIAATADLMYVLISGDDLKEQNLTLVKQIKNRYTDLNQTPKFLLGFDRATMTFKDAPNALLGLDDDEPKISSKLDLSKRDEEKKDFSKFKF